MSRPIGLPKTGGRQKGTPNKGTARLKEILESFNYDPAVALLEKYQMLESREQLLIDLKLMEYFYPKIGSYKDDVPTETDAQRFAREQHEAIGRLSNEEKQQMVKEIFEERFKNAQEDYILDMIKARFPNLIK